MQAIFLKTIHIKFVKLVSLASETNDSGEEKEKITDNKTTEVYSKEEVNNETKHQEANNPHNSNHFHDDNIVTDDDRRWCKEELQQLLDRVYPPLVVRELLILQTGIPGKYLTILSVS